MLLGSSPAYCDNPSVDALCQPSGKKIASLSIEKKAAILQRIKQDSDNAVLAYKNKDFAQAKSLYLHAAKQLEENDLEESLLAVVLCNLAAINREEKNYNQSFKLFKSAINLLYKEDGQDKQKLDYVIKQFTVLLRAVNDSEDALTLESDPQAIKSILKKIPDNFDLNKNSLNRRIATQSKLIGHVKKDDFTNENSLPESVKEETISESNLPSTDSNFPSESALQGTIESTGLEPKPLETGASAETLLAWKTPSSIDTGLDKEEYTGKYKQKYAITIRLVSFKLDEQGAFLALQMAKSLNKKGVDVTLLLDREGVQMANTQSSVQMLIKGHAVSFKEIFKSYLDNGGRVVASKTWSDSFGLSGHNLFPGVELLSDDQMEDEIIRAPKIISY
jgi:tetratricopeptide (TPR) repeat protein